MIPNILWQTWKTHDLPKTLKEQSSSWNISNPQLERRIFDDEECSKYILDNFGKDIHDIYLLLPQNIMRADFWRIAVVYKEGGYYSDLDLICNSKLNDIIPENSKHVFTKEINNISNFFFGAEPNSPILKKTLDFMLEDYKNITQRKSQDFGMHPLHHCVREHYNVIDTNYSNTEDVFYIDNEKLKSEGKFIHLTASLLNNDSEYVSWRSSELLMEEERKRSHNIVFFTTFNKNGYELYGKSWIKSFIKIANYYNKFRAKIYYEGFTPTEKHSSIEWINFEEKIPDHRLWKKQYLKLTSHSEYVKTMTVRFSHKAFVIQDVLDTCDDEYLIWLDGDCVFKNSDFTDFPKNIIENKFLACQLEHAHELNHIESGILIFDGKHSDKLKFNQEFKKWYLVENILEMGQPYDGFIVYKSLITSKLKYVNLNQNYGKGGIQSDPNMTFCHPEIKSKFVHNIGWTGKNQYENWNSIFSRDDVYQQMKFMLFGNDQRLVKKKEKSMNKFQELKRNKSQIKK
jgi:hypothetical protein